MIGIEHSGKKFPVLELLDLALRLVTPHLLVESVQQLLPCGRAGERGAIVERAAERRKSSSPSGVRLKGTPMRSSRSMMPGAASHIAFTGGWLGEEVPA